MASDRIIALAQEMRDLYVRSCALSEQYNALIDDERRDLVKACRARQSAVNELNYFDNVFDRQRAVQQAMADPRIRSRTVLLGGVGWLVIFCVNWVCLGRGSGLWVALAVTMLLGVALLVLHNRFVTASELFRRLLRRQLAERGVPICIPCGYDLRAHIGARCPECGHDARAARPFPSTGAPAYAR